MLPVMNRTLTPLRTLLLFVMGIGLALLLSGGAEASPLTLSSAGADARHPDIVISAGNTTHVVWEQDGGIWHRMQRNGVWTQPVQIVAEGEHPALAVAPTGDIVYLAWSQIFGGNFEIFSSRWNGSAWSAGQNVSSNDGGSATPTIAVAASGDVHLLWSDTSPGIPTIYHAVSTDGLVWPTATPLTDAHGANPTAVFADDGTLHVAWQYRASFAEKNRIWTSSFQSSWQTPTPLTDGSTHALAPRLAANPTRTLLTWQEGDQSHLAARQKGVWQTLRSESGQEPAVSLTDSGFAYWAWADGKGLQARYWYGGSWSNALRWAKNPYGSGDPALAAHGNKVYEVWTENDGQNWRVIFDVIPLGNLYMPIVLK